MQQGYGNQATLESRQDFKNDPRGQYQYWCQELAASERNFRRFIKKGNRVVERFVASGPMGNDDDVYRASNEQHFKLNLFFANTTTLIDTLYGSLPNVDVSRRFADSTDDIGRVAAVMLQRMLNNDIAENGQEIDCILRSNLQDRLVPGLGAARVRYDVAYGEDNVLINEDAICEYVHWRDVRWGWGRSFAELPWIAFRAYLKKEEVEKRFGPEVAKNLQYKVVQALNSDDDAGATDNDDAWMKCEIWEIWDKTKRQVVWVSMGYDKVLDTKDDPLELTNFWPCPPFFAANVTTTLYIPTSDYHLAQDLYNEIDKLQARISIITDAVKVVGLYDSSNGEIARMLKEGVDNDLIPVSNWALFAEKGGIQGQVDWFPIEDVVKALLQLVQMRDQTIALLQQVTGMSDLMRGELKNQYEGVGQTQIKAQFGSVRIQKLQEEFARYATDLMQIKAEVIARHFNPETIIERSNAEYLCEADKQYVMPAIALIKDPKKSRLQVKIESENLAMVDYARLREERSGYITALATFMQSAAPLIEMQPQAMPHLLKLLQWGLAGFKGSGEIEGVLDQAIEQAEQQAKEQQAKEQQGQPDPGAQAEQAKAQAAMQLEQLKIQGELQKIQAKAQADLQVREQDMQADVQTKTQEHMMEMERMQVEMIAALTEIKAKMQAGIQEEVAQSQANIMQTQADAEAEIVKDTTSTELEIAKETQKTSLKLDEIEAQGKEKMKEAARRAAKTDDSED